MDDEQEQQQCESCAGTGDCSECEGGGGVDGEICEYCQGGGTCPECSGFGAY